MLAGGTDQGQVLVVSAQFLKCRFKEHPMHGTRATQTVATAAIDIDVHHGLALEAVKAEHKDRRAFFDGQIRVTGRLHKKGEQSGVLLAIEDNGGGIAKEEFEGVFQPYSGSRGGSHMGMGLSICKLLVRQNRGNIQATESTYLGGARVEIFLPA